MVYISDLRLRVPLKDTQEYFHMIRKLQLQSKPMINSPKKNVRFLESLILENLPLEKLGLITILETMTTQDVQTGLELNFWMP